jgi:outer membrane protein
MKGMVRNALAALVLTAVAAGSLAAQQGPTVVFLDSDRIGQQAPSLQQARQQMQQEMAQLESRAEIELAPLQEEFQRMAQEFQQQQGMMTQERRQQQQQALTQKQQELQRKGAEFEQQAQAKQGEILGPALERINSVIDQIRQERGYSFILDVAAGGVIAADPSLDITEEVLRRLNAQANRGS